MEEAQLHQSEMDLILSGTANTSLADTREYLGIKIQLPPSDRSNRNVQRLQIWVLSILPSNHRLHQFLEDHYNDMESFRPVWSTWRPALFPHLLISRGVFHLKYMSTELSEYCKYQARSSLPLELPNPNAIFSSITQEHHWEPQLSTFFIHRYKLHVFCGVATQ